MRGARISHIPVRDGDVTGRASIEASGNSADLYIIQDIAQLRSEFAEQRTNTQKTSVGLTIGTATRLKGGVTHSGSRHQGIRLLRGTASRERGDVAQALADEQITRWVMMKLMGGVEVGTHSWYLTELLGTRGWRL